MKKWKCTVCGYIHSGDEPPEKCPLCGADKSKFILLEPEQAADEPASETAATIENRAGHAALQKAAPAADLNFLYSQILKHHIHPVSVHIPNGVLPLSVIFIFLSALFGFAGLGKAAFYNLLFVAGAMPLVLFSGFIEWQKRYNGANTYVFLTKMICGCIVFATVVGLVIWMVIDPQAASLDSPARFRFLLVNVVMLAAAAVAGFLGGKLVFKD